jgi:hypothetical protein
VIDYLEKNGAAADVKQRAVNKLGGNTISRGSVIIGAKNRTDVPLFCGRSAEILQNTFSVRTTDSVRRTIRIGRCATVFPSHTISIFLICASKTDQIIVAGSRRMPATAVDDW